MTPYAIDQLEPRRLLAVIDGTVGSDTFVVMQTATNVIVNRNGIPFNFPLEDLTINAGFGADSITVLLYNAGRLTIDGGPDPDTITVGNGNYNANMPSGGVNTPTILGGGGNDLLIIDDSAGTTGGFYETVNQQAPFPVIVGFSTLRIDQIETLRFLCNASNNTIRLGCADRVTFDVRGGGGNDRCEIHIPSTSVPGAAVEFSGGSGSDELIYNLGLSYTSIQLQSNSIVATLPAEWTSVETIRVFANDGDNTISINGIANGATVTVDGEGGEDLYSIGNGDVDASILGLLSLTDTDGFLAVNDNDRIVLQDNGGTTADAYTLARGSSYSFTKTGLANPITIGAGFERITLNAHSGDNAINVTGQDTSASAPQIVINAGAGADTVTFGSGSLIGGSATLSGGTGSDSLVFNDTVGFSIGISFKDYAFAAGMLTFAYDGTIFGGTRQFDYDFEAVTLNAGDYASSFTVSSLGAETALTLNAGAGNDRFILTPFATTSAITFNGQVGADTMTIDDSADSGTDTYTLTKTAFSKTGMSAVSYGTVEAINLMANNSANTININGVPSAVPVTVSGGGGSDVFNVGSGDYDTSISNALTINGDSGIDRIVISDAGDAGTDNYTLTTQTFSKTGGGGLLTYSSIAQFDLTANNSTNTITVTPSSTTTFNVSGGAPTTSPGDVLQIGSPATGGAAAFAPGGAGAGVYSFAAAQDITIASIESFPTPPTTTPSSPGLIAADDTGISNSDGITNRNPLTFTGTATANATVALVTAGGTQIFATTTASPGGAWSITATLPGDGTYVLSAAIRASNGLIGPLSSATTVTIDTVAPPAPAVAPDLSAASDTGVKDDDDITRDRTPAFTGTAPAGSIVRLIADGAAVGLQQLPPTGVAYTVTSSPLADGLRAMRVRHEDVAGNVSAAGPALNVTIDTVAPTLLAAPAFVLATAPHALRYAFSENVGPTLGPQDFTVTQQPSTTVPTSVAFDTTTNIATVTFAANPILPDGRYTSALAAAGVTDIAGNPLSTGNGFNFLFLTADANNDGRVNLSDFNILAANFGQQNRTFVEGDFNYDAIVNLTDFNLLAARFGTTLSPTGTTPGATSSTMPGDRRDRTIDELV